MIPQKYAKALLALTIAVFLAVTLPLASKRPMGGRSSERQGFTAGIIRMYCYDPEHSILNGPQIHFGKNPFNIEWTGFEWLQGKIARHFDLECDSVEQVGKTFSILCAAFALFIIFELAQIFGGPTGGVIAAVTLACDELWTRYATYTMIENRALMLGLVAMLCSFTRRPILAFIFWSLTFVHKAQIFGVCLCFWMVSELLLKDMISARLPKLKKSMIAAVAAAFVVGLAWYYHGIRLALLSDLPWIVHTGPKQKQWYFGNWSERFEWMYWKNQLLTWMRMTGILMSVSTALLFFWTRQTPETRKKFVSTLFAFALPFLAASLSYTFLFYNVFKVHEYYALPLNVMRSLCMGWAFGYLLEQVMEYFDSYAVPALLASALTLFLIPPVIESYGKYAAFLKSYDDPQHADYLSGWEQKIFPKKHAFVVMAVHGYGKDLLNLYLAKQHGFVWCTANEEFAPRKFWKEQGVEYVAWAKEVDPVARVYRYEVRTIDEELRIARERGWSSDLPSQDVWQQYTMPEWTQIASEYDKDPCREGDSDPRKWPTASH